MTAPLASLKVLDLSRMYPGALCTQLLADLGADVVKVEAPGAGDGLRHVVAPGAFNAAHTALNRGKRSLVLDLRHPDAGDVLGPLVGWADVVVESHRPGQLDRLGLGYAAMRVQHPAVVWCSITGFGSSGPNAAAPGHDMTYLGYAGVLGSLADGAPTPPAVTVSLPLAAALGAVGVLATLLEAVRSGTGGHVDVNMTDSAAWIVGEELARAANAPGPGWGVIAARHVYRCADGRDVTVAATEPRTWATLCAALELPDLLEHRLGVDDEAPVVARLTERFASAPAARWLADPGLAGGVGPVNTAADLLDDPQVTERGSVVTLDDGDTRVLANPIRIDGDDGPAATNARRLPPELGGDTAAVLDALGFDADARSALRDRQIIG